MILQNIELGTARITRLSYDHFRKYIVLVRCSETPILQLTFSIGFLHRFASSLPTFVCLHFLFCPPLKLSYWF